MRDVNVTDLVGHLTTVVNHARGLVQDLETGLSAAVRVCDERHAAHVRVAALEEAHGALRSAHEALEREHEATVGRLEALLLEHRRVTEALARLEERCDGLLQDRHRAADELEGLISRLRPRDTTLRA